MTRPGQHLHLALVTPTSGPVGGLEKFARFVVSAVLDAGGQATIALSGQDIFEHPARDAGQLHVEHVDWLDATLAGDRRYCWSSIGQRRAWFRRVRPDVALFVQSSNTPYRSAIAGALLAGVPIVTTHRTMPYAIPHVPSRRHLLGLLPGIGMYRRKLVAKTWLTAAMASRIVYNSHAVRHGYEQDYRFPASKGEVILNAIENSLRPMRRPPREQDAIHIGYVGRLSREKRLEVLLRAFAILRTARPVRLVFFGQGPQETALRQLAHTLGLDTRIDWRGPVTDLTRTYAALDIVAICSPRESSSNMILEAMAAGKAVVVTHVGGLPELVDGGRSGLIVPPESNNELAAALTRLIEDDTLRRTLGESAAATARTRHSSRAVADAWLRLLARVSGRRQPAPPDPETPQPYAPLAPESML